MSSRKRPLAEISQSISTPSRYAPSTPHAIRALQQRSGAKTRSARSVRRASANEVRPDSVRAVLRRFAKISAPVTKKRITTPNVVSTGKENRRHLEEQDDENDSLLLTKPNLTFAIDESLDDDDDDDDSELPVAPTPSILPDDDDVEQPTVTFHNVFPSHNQDSRSTPADRRRSRASMLGDEAAQAQQAGEQEGDITIMTERGRRAISEEVTGRFARYSFGSIRMSDFGSELEIRRESAKYKDLTHLEDDYIPLAVGDDVFDGGETENLRGLLPSPLPEPDDHSVQMSPTGDETFRLDVPLDQEEATAQVPRRNGLDSGNVVSTDQIPSTNEVDQQDIVGHEEDGEPISMSRRQTLLEIATTKAQSSRRKRIKLTRHGTMVPSLPSSVVKRVVLNSYEKQGKRKPQLGRDHMKALEQATEWFFEQAGEDLAAYSSHGRRKKRIDIDDALLLMRRQRVSGDDGEVRKLAKSWLPREILDELDLPGSP